MRESILKCTEKIKPGERIVLHVEECIDQKQLYTGTFYDVEDVVDYIPEVEKICSGTEVIKRYNIRTENDVAAALIELLYFGYNPLELDSDEKFISQFRSYAERNDNFVFVLVIVAKQNKTISTQAKAEIEISVRKKED